MIRRIVPTRDEAERLSEIERTAFDGRETPWSVDKYMRFAENPRAVILADEDLERGLIIVRFAADEGEIINLGVVPLAQREGLGRALLDEAEAIARREEVRHMFLEVALDNIPARQLYARAGYTMVGRRRGYYSRPDGSHMDALILAKALE